MNVPAQWILDVETEAHHAGDVVRLAVIDLALERPVSARRLEDAQCLWGRASAHDCPTTPEEARETLQRWYLRTDGAPLTLPADIDREALRAECRTYVAAEQAAEGAYRLGMAAARQQALRVSDEAIARGLRPEHVKAYIEGRL